MEGVEGGMRGGSGRGDGNPAGRAINQRTC